MQIPGGGDRRPGGRRFDRPPGTDYLSDQVTFWRAAIRTSEEEVFQAKQELAQRKYVGYDGREPDTSVQEQNLKHAQAKLTYAETKVETVRAWQRKLVHAVSETYDGPARQFSATLETDVPRGLALLERKLAALDAYLNIAPVGPQVEAPPAAAPPEKPT